MKRVKFTTDQQLASARRNHFALIGFFSCGIRNDDAGSAAMAGSPWPAISMLCHRCFASELYLAQEVDDGS
jgi:hypothetical protein